MAFEDVLRNEFTRTPRGGLYALVPLLGGGFAIAVGALYARGDLAYWSPVILVGLFAATGGLAELVPPDNVRLAATIRVVSYGLLLLSLLVMAVYWVGIV